MRCLIVYISLLHFYFWSFTWDALTVKSEFCRFTLPRKRTNRTEKKTQRECVSDELKGIIIKRFKPTAISVWEWLNAWPLIRIRSHVRAGGTTLVRHDRVWSSAVALPVDSNPMQSFPRVRTVCLVLINTTLSIISACVGYVCCSTGRGCMLSP